MRSLRLKMISSVGYALAVAASMSGCSLSGRDGGSAIYVDLSSYEDHGASRFSLLDTSGASYGLTAPPTSATGFSCYGVNVTGPGIADSSPRANSQDLGVVFDKLIRQESFCSYRGVVTPTITLGANATSEVALQVPPGGIRLVQVVGVNDPLVCASGELNDPVGSSSGGGRFYEVGRAVLGDVFGDQSVDVAMNWPATAALQAARAMDCGGNCSLLDQFNAGAASSAGYGTQSAYAQRIPPAPGKYIRSVDVDLNLTTADTITVEIYQSATAASSPGSTTGYSSARALPAATTGSVSFGMQTVNGYLQMQSGYDYWIVVTSPASTGNANSWIYTSGTGSDAAQFGGTWVSMSTNAGFNFRVNECGN